MNFHKPAPSFLAHIAHAAEIQESILRIQARYHRETGMRLPLDQAYAMHCEQPDPNDIIPDRGVLVGVKYLLATLGYSDMAISGAISDIARDGTCEMSLWVDGEDKAAVEAEIPGDPSAWPDSTDADVWETVSII